MLLALSRAPCIFLTSPVLTVHLLWPHLPVPPSDRSWGGLRVSTLDKEVDTVAQLASQAFLSLQIPAGQSQLLV